MKFNDLRLLRINNEGQKVFSCPVCGHGESVEHPNTFYARCNTCLATLITYKPGEHQENFHKSKAQYRLNIGGYGSGKTTADVAEISHHILSVPNGRTLIMAQTLQQLKEAAVPELNKFLPPWFLETKPTNTRYKLKNGHEVLLWASDKSDKLRSLNLTAFLLVEASGIAYDVFTEAQSRLRNGAAIIRDKEGNEIGDNFIGLVETNPEEGWVRDEFLLKSSVVLSSKSVDITGYAKLKAKDKEKHFHTFLSATPDNKHLPNGFLDRLIAGKDAKWIRKYIYCYLEVRDGAVYPELSKAIVDPFPIPDHWLRAFGFDKGWSDETCLVCIALDVKNGIGYIYDEYYQSEKPISYHAAQVRERVYGKKLYKNIQADPAVRQRNDRDGVSYQQYFQNVSNGIYLEPGNNDIFAGIERVRDFMYSGKLKIFSSCVNIIDEGSSYVYKKNKDGLASDDPVDKKNHLMDSLRYVVMSLPIDIRTIRIYTNDSIISSSFNSSRNEDINEEVVDGYGGVYGIGNFS